MERINALLKLYDDLNVDGLLISSVASITYLTGFTGDSSRLIIAPAGSYLLTDGRYTEQAGVECHKGIEIFKWLNDNRYGGDSYGHVCEKLDVKRLGFEADSLVHSEFTELLKGLGAITAVPLSGVMDDLRSVKDEGEIEKLKEACSISDKALENLLPYIKTGVTELELSARLEYELKMAGSEGISFDTIVLFGKRTSLLHGQPGNTPLVKGDLILFDFGGIIGGYHADMSRCMVHGQASAEQKDLYENVLNAQQSAAKAIRAGVRGNYPDEVVRRTLKDKYLPYYYPGLGHGVGLEIHEKPFMKNTSDFIFRENMTVTVEPGCYIPGWGGIRVEDTIIARPGEPEIITGFSRDLLEV